MGLIMPRIEGLSSSAAEINEATLKGLSAEARGNALSDLSRIEKFMEKNTIGDFQVFMDGKSGLFYIHDPQAIVMGKKQKIGIDDVIRWTQMLSGN